MNGAEHPDANLVARVAKGDGEAFARLFDRHAPSVLGLLVRMTGHRGEAEELLQETFLQVWRRADQFRSGGSTPRGWILMIARSRALDAIRSRRAQRRREEDYHRRETASGEGSLPVGSWNLEREERRGQVRAALERLPAEQRRCIEMAFFEGLTCREISHQLGAPLGTVKSRILLGMNRLREALTSQAEP